MGKLQRNYADCTIVFGIDVDLSKSTVVVLNATTGSINFDRSVAHTEEAWRQLLNHFPGARFWACYEAGNRGFGLYRMLRKMGVDCHVVAPSATPKSSVQRQTKTDRRDALALAQLYFYRPQPFVRVPTEQEEAERQLIRTREQLMNDKVRVMNQIKSFLNNYHFQPPEKKGSTSWSKEFRTWLKSIDTVYPQLRTVLDAKLRQLDFLEEEIKQITSAIRALTEVSYSSQH